MTQDQWRRVRDLFERALEIEPADIGAWLDREAGDDAAVWAEAASLLQHHTGAGSFLVQPVAERLLSEDRPLEPGQTVGSYTIVREVGRGGMGRVYLAADARLGRTVALKALPPRLVKDESQRERLRREARAAAGLTHPGICTVYALEELDGDLFIATEFVDGNTLREEIASRRRPAPRDVLQTARELAAALASAHVKGIIHRDLKPENVMRAKDGRLKILDFGLARIEEKAETSVAISGPGAQPIPGVPRAHTSEPSALAGTPAYMSPEQLNGQPVNARADVFAFGVLLYEFSSGTHPFDAPTLLGIAARVLESDAPPLERLRPDLPPQVMDVVERCLRKSPTDRFASAVDIEQALSRDDVEPRRARGTTWWRAHQLTTITLYFLASGLAWQIKEWHPGIADAVFLAIGVAATIGGVFRGHMLFTERVVGLAGVSAERRRAAAATLVMDVLIALALIVDGVILSAAQPLAAVLTLALGVGISLARLVVEPSTTRATFGQAEAGRR